ncbi:LacI family DNA-binding transcriptional regulator [Paenibacillus hunanensis]|uniref:DNA-binding LacI/PurR family transcriptional regulator n=1 Tax=Paenibacillus hunanensis TaxID=539262 RepID=A0ABU1IVA2_9BACL|nr:LacI family DNA-binding transcriptional regulator [Paenibacillus hunanensis]MDR6242945.1 DNA-binding LacI/PurR family transcriptional regulator [Paenibacillus hunanensis]GGJ13267.1 LacI family transcriptional regulator [Paenibacillus hunanensis]
MKKVTLQMIAEQVGVSKALVSKALSNDPAVNNSTREQIWKTAQDMGYRFDKLRKSSQFTKTGNIAVLMPEAYLDDMEYWGKIIRGIDKELSGYDFSMMLSGIDISLEPKEGMPSSISESKVDGALLLGHVPEDYIKAIEAAEIPFVLVDSNIQNVEYDHVLANNYIGAYNATMKLLQSGHRTLAFVGDMETALSFKERDRGFEEAAKDHNSNASADDQARITWVRGLGVSGRGNYTNSEFMDKLRSSIVDEQVTGFFCANDMLAIEALRYLTEWGYRCPEDVSIIGFDDLTLAEFVIPRLTTVQVPKEHMGSRAVKTILDRIKHHETVAEQILLSTRLIERDSVKVLHTVETVEPQTE